MAAWLAGEGRMRGNSGDCKEWRRDIKRGVDYMVECKAYRGRALRIAVGIMALVLVMAGGAEATKFIRNDATGGDCTSIGDWNVATKTCTLATDLGETIQIDSDGITLNGNGNTITGSYSDIGVYLSSRTGVTIKNLNVKQFRSGISLSYSSNNTLSRNNASNNNYGIDLDSSSNNTLSGNNANSNTYKGISLSESSNNTISGNNASNNVNGLSYSGVGIDLFYSSNNTLSGNNVSKNSYQGIVLYSSSNNILSGNNANSNNYYGISLSESSNNKLSSNNANSNIYDVGIFLGSSSNNTLSSNNASNNGNGIRLDSSSNITLSGNNALDNSGDGIFLGSSSNNTLSSNNASSNNHGIWLSDSSNNVLNGNNASDNGYGIRLDSSSNNNTLSGNNANSNKGYHGVGIDLDSSSNNTLSGNNASNNGGYNGGHGIYLSSSSHNTLSGNNASLNNLDGIVLYSSSNNKIYNNIFSNTKNFWIYDSNINAWNITKTLGTSIIGSPNLGGNFWDNTDGTGFSQTCPDGDGDGVCNSIYTLDSNNIDYFPLSMNIDIDKISPANITNLTNITYAPTYINFTWLNPPDPDFSHVMLYLNGAFKTNITAPQNYYNFTGLSPDTLYELGTHTVDSSGNVNETWVNKTARTASISGTTYSISLKSGWNLISAPLNLTTWELGNETEVGDTLNVTPRNCISSIYRYNTTSKSFEKSDHFDNWGWYPATGSGSFTKLEPGRGYWVMAQQDCSLTFIGTAPSDLDIPLNTGWNLIGWYSLNEVPLGEEAVVGNPLNVTPANSLTSIYRYNATSASFEKSDHFVNWGWYPATGSGSFTKLESGRGYWVMVQNEALWKHQVQTN